MQSVTETSLGISVARNRDILKLVKEKLQVHNDVMDIQAQETQ